MARIPQPSLFSWKEVDAESDLTRLRLVLQVLPDEDVMVELERRRGPHGRNDYPVRPTWNAIIAGIVLQHSGIQSLIRELRRNGELRTACGFEPAKGAAAVPTKDAFSHMLETLLTLEGKIRAMFDTLLSRLAQVLPDLGKHLAMDGKALPSAARGRSHEESEKLQGKARRRGKPDRRQDLDAQWGVHEHKKKNGDKTAWTRVMKWFGYTLHLLVDSTYELPLAFEVTKASKDPEAAESPWVMPLLERLDARHPVLIERAEDVAMDAGYDTTRNHVEPWDRYGIRPVIDIRNLRRDGESSWLLDPRKPDNVTYTYDGRVTCTCYQTGEVRRMAFCGFEADRETLKVRCPAAVHGFACKGRRDCPKGRKKSGRIVRIPLATDRRVFTPLARGTRAWQRAYARRTAVERVNGRIDRVYGFETHFIRGLGKMRLRLGLAMVVMLATALAWIELGRPELMRSTVTSLEALRRAA